MQARSRSDSRFPQGAQLPVCRQLTHVVMSPPDGGSGGSGGVSDGDGAVVGGVGSGGAGSSSTKQYLEILPSGRTHE